MSSGRFREPRPNMAVMTLSGYLNEWALLFGPPFIRNVKVVRDLPLCGGYFKVNRIDIPESDREILTRITSPDNAFFFGPNHPEFTTDWLIDKYISTHFAPKMSSWAAASIIRGPLAGFWSANNLIGNDGGDAAKEYSIRCALRGHGTLLHPEGAVRWRSDKVFDLLPGIADMAISAAHQVHTQGAKRKVFIVPVIWKMVYDEDVTHRLTQGIDKLEQVLALPSSGKLKLGARYKRFHQQLLIKQMSRFGYPLSSNEPTLDDAQSFFDTMLNQLADRYGIEEIDSEVHRVLHRIYRSAREAKDRRDTDLVIELQRLAAYSKETFQKEFFYQEEIAEGIQFIRQIFLTGGYDSIRSMLPKPFGWRTVHLRMPEPIEVAVSAPPTPELSKDLLNRVKTTMDKTLSELNSLFADRRAIAVE